MVAKADLGGLAPPVPPAAGAAASLPWDGAGLELPPPPGVSGVVSVDIWLFSVVGAGAGEASPGRAGAGLDITGGGLAGADGATASGTGLA